MTKPAPQTRAEIVAELRRLYPGEHFDDHPSPEAVESYESLREQIARPEPTEQERRDRLARIRQAMWQGSVVDQDTGETRPLTLADLDRAIEAVDADPRP